MIHLYQIFLEQEDENTAVKMIQVFTMSQENKLLDVLFNMPMYCCIWELGKILLLFKKEILTTTFAKQRTTSVEFIRIQVVHVTSVAIPGYNFFQLKEILIFLLCGKAFTECQIKLLTFL